MPLTCLPACCLPGVRQAGRHQAGRFYLVKGPFCDLASAQKHLHLFVLGYVLRGGAQGQACPLERAGGKGEALPLYHLLNRPKVRMLRERMAQQYRLAACLTCLPV